MKKKRQYPKPRMGHIEVGGIIDAMALRECSPDAWQRFTASPIEHPELEAIRLRCLELPALYPPETSDQYCGEEGRHIMFRITEGLYRHPRARSPGHWEELIHGKAPKS